MHLMVTMCKYISVLYVDIKKNCHSGCPQWSLKKKKKKKYVCVHMQRLKEVVIL